MTRSTMLAFVTALFALAGPVRAQMSPALPEMSAAQWRDDLRHFARELPRRHMNAFHTTTRHQFDRAVAALDSAIPTLQGPQIVVGLMRICAMVGDGHTGVHQPASFPRLPVAVFWFGDTLRIVAAIADHRPLVGSKVLRINGTPIREVMARVSGVISQAENEWHTRGTSQSIMMLPDVLHALGIIPEPSSATFTLEDEHGAVADVTLAPIRLDPQSPPRFLGPTTVPPISRRNPESAFYWAVLPDSQTLYVNFRRYDRLEDNARRLLAFIDSARVTRLVIDLRQNDGGDFTKVRRALLPGIKRNGAINTRGHLFVIIGRRTFSAALANAVDFRKETNAILVGEPIGERPNSYSENDEMTLPNSRLIVSYSTRFYRFVEEDVTVVNPDVRIDPAWADQKAGRDAVLEWILSRRD